jgi:hypothetical protein
MMRGLALRFQTSAVYGRWLQTRHAPGVHSGGAAANPAKQPCTFRHAGRPLTEAHARDVHV